MRLQKYDKMALRIPKGQIIYIPILAVNTDKEIWGDDAGEFKLV
jgi:cytochrome P450